MEEEEEEKEKEEEEEKRVHSVKFALSYLM